MTNHWFFLLKLFSAIGCGLIAGVFFAFSTFVMNALSQRPAAEGIAAMQAINITVINPWFMTAFLGTGAACFALIVISLVNRQQLGNTYLIVASLLYLVGTIGVTIGFNVPLNDALAAANPNSPQSTNLWTTYVTNWTFWNHIRTIAALAAATLFTLAVNHSARL